MEDAEAALAAHPSTTWAELGFRLKFFARILAGVAIDAGFLCFWLIMQYVVSAWVLPRFPLTHAPGRFETVTFEWIFAVSTLVPVILYVVYDILVMAAMFNFIRRGGKK